MVRISLMEIILKCQYQLSWEQNILFCDIVLKISQYMWNYVEWISFGMKFVVIIIYRYLNWCNSSCCDYTTTYVGTTSNPYSSISWTIRSWGTKITPYGTNVIFYNNINNRNIFSPITISLNAYNSHTQIS